MAEPTEDVREFWEQFYGEREQKWSGRVNARLAELVTDLPPGRALDLGCGEGADAVWLAEHRWEVTAVDISATALQRARDLAVERNVAAHITFEHHNLSESFPTGSYDLVSAQFLHSPVELDPDQVLRRATGAVAPGGILLIVNHAAAPPWADNHHERHFCTADEVLASLQLDEVHWQQLRVETSDRATISPDGEPATLRDNVIVLRRNP